MAESNSSSGQNAHKMATITLRTLTGAKFTVHMSLHRLCVMDLKRAVHERFLQRYGTGIPPEDQMLFHKGRCLGNDRQMLGDAGLQNFDFLVIINNKSGKSKRTTKRPRSSTRPSDGRLPSGEPSFMSPFALSPHAPGGLASHFSFEDHAMNAQEHERRVKRRIVPAATERTRRQHTPIEMKNYLSTFKARRRVRDPPPGSSGAPSNPGAARSVPAARAPRIPVADKALLENLKNMGFHHEASKKALLLNRNNVEHALNWLLENSTSPDLNKPLSQDELAQLGQRVTASVDSQALREMVEMGFSESDSAAALASRSGRLFGAGLRASSSGSAREVAVERLARLERLRELEEQIMRRSPA